MDYARDARYINIGDLPSGGVTYDFTDIYVRQFILRELPLLHLGMTAKVRPHQHIIRAVQMTCSVDINQLTDGDFCYVMAWLRRNSFPEFPVNAQYTCNNMVYINNKNSIGVGITAKTAKSLGYWLSPCAHKQTELVKRVEIDVHTLDDDDLSIKNPEIDFPRVGTLTDFYDFIGTRPSMKYMGTLARWVKKGSTFKAKLAYLMSQKDMKLLEEIEKTSKLYFHGITERIRLRCGSCNHVKTHESSPSLLAFFADNTDKDIYNMIYNLMSQFGAAPDLDLPVRLFLHSHSTLAAERRDAEAKQKAAQQKVSGRGVYRR